MLLTQFCEIREPTAISGIQFELLTAKTQDKMVWGKPHKTKPTPIKIPTKITHAALKARCFQGQDLE